MDRRRFIASLGTIAAAATLGEKNLFAKSAKPQIAITMDDPQVKPAYGLSAAEINRRILDALDKHRIKADLFVCGMRVGSDEGKQLLSTWNDAGHTLGNHSYSHMFLNSSKLTLATYCDDIAKGEAVVSGYSQFKKRFRYPFFKEGDTVEKRDGVRKFLAERGYAHGRATIDASDWAIDDRLTKRVAQDPQADLSKYRQFYLDHLWERAQFYDDLALKALGRRPAHTLLVHHRLLNALFLGDVLDMFEKRGWEPISAEKAYEDPIYQKQPTILPAGESLVWALAKESGKFESVLRYPGEDDSYENPKMDALGL
jgi:peptidoglycan/xylan/chitin deacetylase (PgdA/CDA1 family)